MLQFSFVVLCFSLRDETRINLHSRKGDYEKILENKDGSREEKYFSSFPKTKAVFFIAQTIIRQS